ncbi:VOC family protein [Variovorax sp. J22R133]|uniref:VOC family protein n=1 Tax=Variovorax brevis TaxID=3053503 RepID=UPI002575BAEB|nr:VOC family protein [Variovorax sp. J22R133]MDM0113161.1 VOC family protein [Variovorax sp. J22R133]
MQAVNWFEIPVKDLDRAQRFYESVLSRSLRREVMDGQPLAVFPYDEPHAGGCLQADANAPAMNGQGVLIYLDCSPSIDATLGRIEKAGGEVVEAKTALPGDMGFYARVRDTEGNVVGLHALA